MKKDILISIVIPVRKINDYIRESIPKILEQSYINFEIIILPDQETTEKFPKTRIISSWPQNGPADKRDKGASLAKGEILSFLDDDAYPDKNWLENAVDYFSDNDIVAVCGPGVTPPSVSLLEKASGWISASTLGGGPYTYRFLPQAKRKVDDYPSMNLFVRKEDFEKIGGFDSNFWPGEDTKLCLDLVNLGKKIIYDPKILVYHHRRPLFKPHLKQNGGYGLHRGHFARILPQTSLRLAYLIPVIFTLGLLVGPFLILMNPFFAYLYLGAISVYILLLIKEGIWVYGFEKNLKLSSLVMLGIFLTHAWYGLRFIQGFFTPKLTK